MSCVCRLVGARMIDADDRRLYSHNKDGNNNSHV